MSRTPEQLERLRKRVERWNKLTEKEKGRRMHVWRHNSYKGHVAMARMNMHYIAIAQSVTKEASELAANIEQQLLALQDLLNTRIDDLH